MGKVSAAISPALWEVVQCQRVSHGKCYASTFSKDMNKKQNRTLRLFLLDALTIFYFPDLQIPSMTGAV